MVEDVTMLIYCIETARAPGAMPETVTVEAIQAPNILSALERTLLRHLTLLLNHTYPHSWTASSLGIDAGNWSKQKARSRRKAAISL